MDFWLPYIRFIALVWFAVIGVLIYRAMKAGMRETAHIKIDNGQIQPSQSRDF